ncbi:hypothetical protein D770_04800 [Flammeovirgaceae bacterium 311]|nr:hypothetical protein D770_04800 [Flammeovirgaceae bacterium 311]
MLGDACLDVGDPDFEQITKDDFERVWRKRNPVICQTIDREDLSIEELERIEFDLPVSDKLYQELFSSGCIDKLQYLPMKYGPIQDFEEAIVLNEALEEIVQIFQSNFNSFSAKVQPEIKQIINFIRQGKENGYDIQFFL